MMPYEKDPNEIGALWNKTTGAGKQYMTGKVTVNGQDVSIVCFGNSSKSKDTHPDWRVLISQPKQSEPPQQQRTAPRQTANPTDDIPF
jgi:uncharacterized protein (DUF736 family)